MEFILAAPRQHPDGTVSIAASNAPVTRIRAGRKLDLDRKSDRRQHCPFRFRDHHRRDEPSETTVAIGSATPSSRLHNQVTMCFNVSVEPRTDKRRVARGTAHAFDSTKG